MPRLIMRFTRSGIAGPGLQGRITAEGEATDILLSCPLSTRFPWAASQTGQWPNPSGEA